jgi:magnesium chelatase family protein
VPFTDLADAPAGEKSENVRARVINARNIQQERFKDHEKIYSNAQMSTKDLGVYCKLNEQGNTLLKNAMEKLNLSARAYDRIIKVARTIADLDGKQDIATEHLAEAIQYRSLDRETWGM